MYMSQKYTDNKKASNRKWDAANLDRLSLALPKGNREKIKLHAAAVGQSVNQYISQAIAERMDREVPDTQEDAQGGGVVSVPIEDAPEPTGRE